MNSSSSRRVATIAIAAPHTGAYSETFIRTHILRLPFQIVSLTGSQLTLTGSNSNLLESSRLSRLVDTLQRRLGTSCAVRFRNQRIAKFLTEAGVSLVLGEYGMVAAQMTSACRLCRIPLIAHFHGYDAHCIDVLSYHESDYKTLFGYARAVVGSSRAMCRQLVSLGASPEQVHYIPYFVDPHVFTESRPDMQPPTFLAVGRFVEKKAPHLTILAFSKLLSHAPEARLRLIGEGPLLGACKSLTRALGIADAVDFLGVQSHEQVSKAMQSARCFVQHSVIATDGDSEGTPVAILEAQAAGLPVVATRHTGIEDVVVHATTGFLVDEANTEEMAKCMQLMVDRPSEARELGKAARARVLEHFGYPQTLGKLSTLITTIIRDWTESARIRRSCQL